MVLASARARASSHACRSDSREGTASRCWQLLLGQAAQRGRGPGVRREGLSLSGAGSAAGFFDLAPSLTSCAYLAYE
eukprot:9579557-Alexandrium_andersonii.AAC.1